MGARTAFIARLQQVKTDTDNKNVIIRLDEMIKTVQNIDVLETKDGFSYLAHNKAPAATSVKNQTSVDPSPFEFRMRKRGGEDIKIDCILRHVLSITYKYGRPCLAMCVEIIWGHRNKATEYMMIVHSESDFWSGSKSWYELTPVPQNNKRYIRGWHSGDHGDVGSPDATSYDGNGAATISNRNDGGWTNSKLNLFRPQIDFFVPICWFFLTEYNWPICSVLSGLLRNVM